MAGILSDHDHGPRVRVMVEGLSLETDRRRGDTGQPLRRLLPTSFRPLAVAVRRVHALGDQIEQTRSTNLPR